MPVAQGPWDMNRRASVRATETGRNVRTSGGGDEFMERVLAVFGMDGGSGAAEGEEGREKVKKGMGESKRRNEYGRECKLRQSTVTD